MTMLKYKIFTTVLCVFFSVTTAIFAAPEEMMPEAASYVNPTADLVIFFDTKLAEKKIDPELQKKMKKAQMLARAANEGDIPFDFQNRDITAVINLKVIPGDRFACNVSGAAVITGNLSADMKELQKLAKNSPFTLEPEKDSAGRVVKNCYILQFEPKKNNTLCRLHIKIGEKGRVFFSGTINRPDAALVPLSEKNKEKNPLLNGLSLNRNVFTAAVKPAVFLPFMKPSIQDDPQLKRILTSAECCQLTINVEGIWMECRLYARFNDPDAMALSYNALAYSLNQFRQSPDASTYCRNLAITKSPEEKAFRLRVDCNLDRLWETLVQLEQKLSEEMEQISDEPGDTVKK